MTPIDRTTATPKDLSSTRLQWATITIAIVSIAAVVLLALTHMEEAAAAVGTIGAMAVSVQLNRNNRS